LIDIHAHILPGIDDGASSLEQAVAMAESALRDGVSTIVATPHSSELAAGVDPKQVSTRVAELKAALVSRGVKLDIVPGLENYLTPDLVKQAETSPEIALGDGNGLLVELPLQQYPMYTEQVLFELQILGKQPVLAHPERNAAIQEDLSLLQRLVERGILAQVTAASLTGHFGGRVKKIAEEFVERRLVHVIATDAHSHDGARSPLLSQAVSLASKLVGEETARRMVTEVPDALLKGHQLVVEPPLEPVRRRSWAFWRGWR
jgi:protein-tyrosine phosphatase